MKLYRRINYNGGTTETYSQNTNIHFLFLNTMQPFLDILWRCMLWQGI